jgi:hypothetical protein
MDKASESKVDEKEVKLSEADSKKVKQEAVDALLQEGIDFFIDVNRPGPLRRIGILPKSYKFVLYPIYLGTLQRISKIMVDMEFADKVSQENFQEMGIETMAKHTEDLINIVAIAIHNKEGKPNKRIKKILKRHTTPTELLGLVSYVMMQMDVSGFMKSIISVKGMSLIKQGG